MRHSGAFSLIEVTLALGIVAFALVAILGLVPVALRSAKEATEDTRVSLIAQDVAVRSRTLFSSTAAPSPSTNWWYDTEGRFLDQSAGVNFSNAFFRVNIVSGDLGSYPTNVSGSALRGVKATMGWPVDTANGGVIAPAVNEAKAVFPMYLRPQ